MSERHDLRFTIEPFEISVDGKFRIDPQAARGFLERFFREHGRDDVDAMKDRLSDEFSEFFGAGALVGVVVMARIVHVDIYDVGGLHTAPARRPRGPQADQ